MSMQSTKAQHYVPRLYLKQWADEDEKIWCLDRKSNRTINLKIMRVAQEHFFYEMNCLCDDDIAIIENWFAKNGNDLIRSTNKSIISTFKMFNDCLKLFDKIGAKKQKEFLEKNFVEKMFETYEGEYATLIKKILDDTIPDWNEDNKMTFLLCLNLQYFRTKNISENILDNASKVNVPKQYGGLVERIMNPIRWLMANTVTCNMLEKQKFIFIENKTNLNFVTTDQPVINVFSILDKKSSEMSREELELYCPFSPKKAVLVSFRDCYTDMSSISASEKDVRFYNDILVKCSNRFVFSKDKGGLNPWLEENQ